MNHSLTWATDMVLFPYFTLNIMLWYNHVMVLFPCVSVTNFSSAELTITWVTDVSECFISYHSVTIEMTPTLTACQRFNIISFMAWL